MYFSPLYLSYNLRYNLSKLLLIALLGNINYISKAQNLHFSHFSDAEGLSQNSIRKIYEDSKGYIWIGTEDGLNRYTGTYNEVYQHKNEDSSSIAASFIYDIKEDKASNIWVSSYKGIDKWNRISNRFIHYKPKEPKARGYGILIGENNEIWAYSDAGLYKVDTLKRELAVVPAFTQPLKTTYKLDKTNLMLVSVQGDLYTYNTQTEKVTYLKHLPAKGARLFYFKDKYVYWVSDENTIIQSDLLFEKNRSFPLESLKEEYKNALQISSLLEENGIFYIGMNEDGMIVYDTLSQKKTLYEQSLADVHGISDNRIKYIYKSEKSPILWVGTYGRGLNFCSLSQQYFHSYSPNAKDKTSLSCPFIFSFCEKNANEVWIGTDGEGLELWNRITGTFSHIGNLGNPAMNRVMAICQEDANHLLIGAHGGLFRWDMRAKSATFIKTPLEGHPLTHVSTLAKAPNGDIWVAGEDDADEEGFAGLATKDANFWVYHPKTNTWDYLLSEQIDASISKSLRPGYVFSDAKRVYFLLENKIYYQQNQIIKQLFIPQITENKDFVLLLLDNKDNIWLQTEEQGIISYNFISQKMQTYQKALLNEKINAFLQDEEGNLWISHDHGLSKLYTQTARVVSFDLRDGLQSNEFIRRSALKLSDGSLLFGGVNGFNHFKAKDIEKHCLSSNLRIIINKVTALVKEKTQTETQNIENELAYTLNKENIPVITLSYKLKWATWMPSLSLDYGSLTFYYSALEYIHPQKCRYRYRLKKGSEVKDFEGTQQLQVRFPQELSPGTYTFEVQVSKGEGVWSKSAEVLLIIQSHWTQTNTFRILLSLFFFGLATLLVYQRIQIIREKDAEAARIQNEITGLKSKSLRAQMNPHFIFNALNSVQDFILDHNFRESARYLTKFSRLIRLILDHSESQFVILGKEIELISYYIDMEMLRFSNKFSYSIEVDAAIDKETILIPSMILQPYIENAIWHGLMHKKNEGTIEIHFALLPTNLIKCTIKDNGIGREASAEINKNRTKSHQSRGMDITKQQIELLRHQNNWHVKVEVIDLKDENGKAEGTEILIYFPYKKE